MSQTTITINTDGGDLRDNPDLDDVFADLFASAARRVSDRATDALFNPTPIGGSGLYQKAPVAPLVDYTPDSPAARYNTDKKLQLELDAQRRQQERDAKDAERTAAKDARDEARAKAKAARDTAREQAKAQREAKKLAAQQAKDAKALAQAEAERKEEIASASRAKGNAVYGYGNLAKSVTAGGLSSGTGVGQGIAQLGSSGVLGSVAAGFGPAALGIGMAVDAGTQLISGSFHAMKTAIEMGEKAVKQIAGNDGLGLLQTGAEGAAKTLESVPVVGKMFAEGLRAAIAPIGLFKSAMEAFSGRAKELAQYDGRIALADANAEMKTMFADMKEANKMGASYANLLEREQEMNQAFQEALAPIKAVLINTLADVAEFVKMVMDGLPILRSIDGSASTTVSLLGMIPMIGDAAKALVEANRAMRESLKKIEEGSESTAVDDLDKKLEQLELMPAGQGDGRAAEFDRANKMPAMMNPPRL